MITRLFAAFVVLTGLAANPTRATDLILPERAKPLSNRVLAQDSYALAIGPFDAGRIETLGLEGRVERLSWRMNDSATTTLQVLTPLRDQLARAGYKILFECRDSDCGGFDFRFGIDVIAAPDMHVNIRDYRYLAALRGTNEALSLLISRTGEATYIQMIHASPDGAGPPGTTGQPGTASSPPAGLARPDLSPGPDQPNGLAAVLQKQGHVVLSDLVFDTGAARLGKGPFTSLRQLADFLNDNPGIRIALVGHTDSVGSLNTNISLSKRRAGSVRTRMTEKYKIAPSRIEAEGMGYLAPIATNLTPKGREANRRVEAILLSDR